MYRTRNAFIIFESCIRFYAEGPDGEALGAMWMGGFPETLEISHDLKTRLVQRPGKVFSQEYQEDEEFTFDIKNLWLEDLSPELPTMPRIDANMRYTVVVRWLDEDTCAWVKRSYYGVMARGRKQGGDAYQDVKFRAEQMFEIEGYENEPDMTPFKVGTIRYVNEGRWFNTHRYDFVSKQYSLLDSGWQTPYVLIDETNPAQCEISIDGTPALLCNADGLNVNELVALGSTIADDGAGARMEFWIGTQRIAALTKTGKLMMVNFIEQDAAPMLADVPLQFQLGLPTWFASIAPGCVYSKTFNEPE